MTIRNISYFKNSLKIREFKFSQMCAHPVIVMIAKRGSGKSILCAEVLKYFDDYPVGAIISETDELVSYYSSFFPDIYIHPDYSQVTASEILERQKKMKEKRKKKNEKGYKLDIRSFLLMDDCLANNADWKKDVNIRKIFMNGRHYGLLYILTMQYPLGIHPELRENIDYVFLLACNKTATQKKIYDAYCGIFPTFGAFLEVFQKLTDNYGCMVIDSRSNKNNIQDVVFWFKANNRSWSKRNKFGCRQFRYIHDDNYDDDWSRNNKDDGIDKIIGKKSKKGFHVEKIDADY